MKETPENKAKRVAERVRRQRAEREARKIRRLLGKFLERIEQTQDPALITEWEKEFLSNLPEDLEKYGRGWNNPALGVKNEPLSRKQKAKLRQIDKLLRTRMQRKVEEQEEE